MAVPLRTRREKAHYGDKVMIGETPAVKIKDGKILTAKVVTNEDGKEVYEIKQKKNVIV